MHLSLKALFESDGEMPPLFRSHRDLARALCEHRGLGEEKLNSVGSFVGQLVRGERSMPDEWKRQIRLIVERRAKDRGINDLALSAYLAVLDQETTGGSVIQQLVIEQARARDTLILNACPLELTDAKFEHAEAARLQQLVLEALENGRRYHYCVASQSTALRVGRALLRTTEEKYGNEAERKARDWLEKGLLAISVVPDILLLHPTVAFNTSAPDRLGVYVWHAPFDWEYALAIPPRQTAAWLGMVQHVLETESRQMSPFPS